jgi:long-chain fatty acid transport protein
MRLHRASRFLSIALAVVTAIAIGGANRSAAAQGFGLNEIGSCAVARGFANTGSPCKDASMIFWNPAAVTTLPGWNLTAGAAAIALSGKFEQDTTRRVYESDIPTAIVPHLFLNYHAARSRLAYGLGLYVPYGLTSQWTDDFPGRFQAKRASLQTIYVQPNIAFQLNPKWSIGAGPIFGHSTVELIQGVDLSAQTTPVGGTFAQLGIAAGTEFARAKLKGDATAWGGQVGIFGQPTAAWSLGVRYLTPVEFQYDEADVTFTQVSTGLVLGGAVPNPSNPTGAPLIPAGTRVDQVVAGQFTTAGKLVTQNASTKITHPGQVEAGIGYSGFKNWNLMVDYAWVGWSSFDVIDLRFSDSTLNKTLIEEYKSSSAIRVGAEYTVPGNAWKLRGGFVGVAAAAPDETVTPLLPEQDRNYYTLGVGIPFMNTWGLDASYAYIRTPGRRGRIVERATTSQTAAQLNSGVYGLTANIFSLTVKASF